MTNDFIPGSAEPSEAQKAAGNYAKGHRFLHGMRISVENAAGTMRRGVGKDGTPWEQEMKHDYGYIRGSKGKDKDHLDVFMGPEADNPDHPVFVIDQEDPDTGAFDEHKALFGFPDAASARAAYLSNYPEGWSADRAVTEMPVGEFKKWAYVGAKGGKRLPAHQLRAFQERAEVKSDEPEGFAAGGAVGKKAVPLLKHLLENGIEGVLPKLQELVGRTDATGHEHALTGFVENAGEMNEKKGFRNQREPQVHTDNKSGTVSLPAFGQPDLDLNRVKTLNAHSHPPYSFPAPSEPDMLSWRNISQSGLPGQSIILRGGSPRMAYGAIDFEPYASLDQFHPEKINAANTAIDEGVRKGFYDRPLKDAGIDPKEAWRVRALRNYLAGSYWEPQGVASYSHDMPSITRGVQESMLGRGLDPAHSFFSPDPELINKIIDATWNPTEDLLRNTKGFGEGGGVDPAELERHFMRGVQGRPDHECSCGNKTKMFTGPSNAPSEGFAGGGLVKKIAVPLAEHLRELGLEHLLPKLESIVKLQDKNELEYGIKGNPDAVGRPKKGTEEALNLGSVRSPGDSFIAHTHPQDSIPLASMPDINMRSENEGWRSLYDNAHDMVLSPTGVGRIAYSSSSRLANDPELLRAKKQPYFNGFNSSLPRFIDKNGNFLDDLGGVQRDIQKAMQEAYADGHFKSLLEGKNIPEITDKPGFREGILQFLGHSYFDDLGATKSGYDIPRSGEDPERVNNFIRDAWPLAYDVLKTTKPGGYADGGTVDEDLSRPAFRTPMVARRREDRQDREGAKEVPVQLLRGLLTGTLGFGGDMEGLARSVGSALGAKIDETPTLPTGDFFRDVLPGAPQSASGRAASELGNMGAVPLSAGVLGGIRAARGAAPVVRGALTRMMENASREPEALVAGRRPGSARAMQSGAVKNPGGNWFGPHLDRELKELRGWEADAPGELAAADAPMSIADWMEKRTGDYVRNKMGTVNDPLLKLEAEGRLHLTPQQLAEISPGSRMTDQLHRDLTGRETRTPWETASDAQIENVGSKAALRNAQGRGVQIPDWLQRTNRPDLPYGGPSVDVYDIDPGSLERLGFGHIRDYLDQATANHDVWRSMRENPEQFQLDDTINRVRQFEGAGLLIDPAKLGKMSFADVAGKVGDWNAAMKRWEQEARAATDWNKGIKSVMKEYPETGGRWVELNPEALADEGTAMGHCVGGYCSSVESGRNRILSYRDKNGPHVTVELTPPSLTDMVKTLPQADRGAFWDEVSKKGISNAEAQEYFKELHGELPWNIAQIKGKGNLKPIDDYIPAVQDLVRNMGPWGEIRDLKNSGLVDLRKPSLDPDYVQRTYGLKYPEPGLYPQNDLRRAFEEANPEIHVDDNFLDIFNGRYASGGSVGANIGAGDTVGLGTYAPSAQGQTAPRRAADSTAGMGAGIPQQQSAVQQQQLPYNANALEQWGAGINGFGNNSDTLSKLPTWKVGDEAAEKDIADYIKVAHQGTDFQGMGAFLRAGPTWNSGVGGDTGDFGSWDMRTTGAADDLARQLGLGQIDWTKENLGMTGNSTLARMNDMLKDYRLIAGLTRDPNDPERAMGEGLYKNINGTWTPIAGRIINAPESHGWARSESGGSFLQAMSMMAPAVGGFAGLASAAAPSAYGAATGAIGTTATNAIINALGQYALTGNPTGALTSLFGAAGGAGGSALASSLDPAYAELGKFIGTQAGRNIGKRATT